MMKKLIYLMLLAVVAPFFQSCNTDSSSADTTILATVRTEVGSKYGFSCVLDNYKTMQVTNLRCTYKPTNGERLLLYCDIDGGAYGSGYDYSADIYQIMKVVTTDVKTLSAGAEDNFGKDGMKVTNAWVAGGYLNLEFQVYLNNHSAANCEISLVDNQTNGNKNDGSNNYFELELRNKSNLNLEENHTSAYGIACFKLRDFDPEKEGLTGIKLTYTKLGSKDNEKETFLAKINTDIDIDLD